MNTAKIIGLTGGIACGKSTVSKYLASKDIFIIDADKIVRHFFESNDDNCKIIQENIFKIFGTLNRLEIRQIIFNNEHKRKQLEALLHPEVREAAKTQIELNINAFRIIIYEAPLLIESLSEKQTSICEKILLITCDPELQIQRIMERDKTLDLPTAKKIIQAQMPQEEKIQKATWVIENNNDLNSLNLKIENWLSTVCART